CVTVTGTNAGPLVAVPRIAAPIAPTPGPKKDASTSFVKTPGDTKLLAIYIVLLFGAQCNFYSIIRRNYFKKSFLPLSFSNCSKLITSSFNLILLTLCFL